MSPAAFETPMPASDQKTAPAKRSRTEPCGARRARQSRTVAATTWGRNRCAKVSSIAAWASFECLTLPACFGTFEASRMAPEASKSFPDDARIAPHPSVRRDRVNDEHGNAEEDIIALGWYVRAVLRRWKLALLGAIIGGVLAFWFASIQPSRYEGVTTLLVVPPSQPNSVSTTPATFRAIVENGSLALQVISELKLHAGERPLTPLKFLEDMLRVEEVRGTNIVRVRVTLEDPKAAAEASRLLAAKA